MHTSSERVDIISEKETIAKRDRLITILKKHAPLAVALSGGTDSAFLLKAAKDAIGDQVVALTSVSPLTSADERRSAAAVARSVGVRQVEVASKRLGDPRFAGNPENRCYICKQILWREFLAEARRLKHDRVADGLCLDDLDDDRPGTAANTELGILSPLLAAGLAKEDILRLSKSAGLPVWDKPPDACLATRIPHGTTITTELLAKIEQAETFLKEQGFSLCRVRSGGDTARIEVAPEFIERLAQAPLKSRISLKLRELGFSRVALDLDGYGGRKP